MDKFPRGLGALKFRALTCCRGQCPAAKCGRKAREAFARHRTLLDPTAICNRSTTVKIIKKNNKIKFHR